MKETKLTQKNIELFDFELFENKFYSRSKNEIFKAISAQTKGKIKPEENDYQTIFNDAYLVLIQKISKNEFVHENDTQTWVYISKILYNKSMEYYREMFTHSGQYSRIEVFENEDTVNEFSEVAPRKEIFSEKLEIQYYKSFGSFAEKYKEHLKRNLLKVRNDRLIENLDEDFFYHIEKEFLEVFIEKFKELKPHYQLCILFILQKQYSYKQMLGELAPFYQDTINIESEDAYGYWRVALQRAKEELFNLIFETFKQKNIWKR